MRLVTLSASAPDQVFASSAALLEAVEDGHVWASIAVVQGPVIVLGAWQHPALTLSPRHDRPVVHRATSGTAGFIAERGVLLSLALPSMQALVPDTLASTLLNRNVRGWLNGLTSVGATAQYYGREWLAVRHQPCGLLGLEVDARGRVLLEMLLGWEASIALPETAQSGLDLTVDRWLGKTPVSLRESVSAHRRESPLEVARAIATRAAERWSQSIEPVETGSFRALKSSFPETVGDAVRCEAGYIAASSSGGDVWLGGDALVGSATRSRLMDSFVRGAAAADALTSDDVMLGVRSEDWDNAWRLRSR